MLLLPLQQQQQTFEISIDNPLNVATAAYHTESMYFTVLLDCVFQRKITRAIFLFPFFLPASQDDSDLLAANGEVLRRAGW